MRAPRLKQQAGYVLIMMVLGLMGVGGLVLAGFTQGAKEELDQRRAQHNRQVLKEAKQALLMYAYRYPEITGNPNRGPGRLPCPDLDNNGRPDPDIANFCVDGAGDAMVGRFPWDANGMQFYDARDASNQRLWYAVSNGFNNVDPNSRVNSDLAGSITIHDQDGRRIYDGSANGIAAVIIAPGPPIDRNGVLQDRSIGNGDDPQDTTADTDPGIVDPARYLDLFGALDNADFINDDANDGFVLGPIDDLAAEELIVNDQVILVTAEEVLAMAEKATLQAYREALEIYLGRPGFGRYPWLEAFDSDANLDTFDAQVVNPVVPPAPLLGRVPSTFERYFFTGPNSNLSEFIVSEITLKFNIDGERFEGRIPPGAANVRFLANGDLVVPDIEDAVVTGWAWDGSPSQAPTFAEDGIFEACPYVTGTEEDCNQDAPNSFIGGGTTAPFWLTTREYEVTFNTMTTFPLGERTVAPVVYVPPTATSHGYIEAEYDGPAYIISVTWEEDEEFQDGHDIFPAGNIGNLFYTAGDTVTVGIRYYPELPRWLESNGWHDMMQAAYAGSMAPGGGGDCVAAGDCLTVQGTGGTTNDKPALLILSGGVGDLDPNDDDLTDAVAGSGFANDLGQIFEDDNIDLDRVFDKRPNPGPANDVILVME